MAAAGYLGMRPGDLDGKRYARHWNPEMAPLALPVREALRHGPEAAELGTPLSEVHRLLDPGYQPIENGWLRLPSGQTFVAVHTLMPGVTSAMIDWWFGWHGAEAQRYKLWHPRAHVGVRMQRALADAPDLGDREKYVGNVSYVTEYIGDRVAELAIAFREPREYFDTARFAEARVGTAICARTGFASRPPLDVGHLIHLIRETSDGCEMRSRFWLGDVQARFLSRENPVNRYLLRSPVVARAAVPPIARDLVVHCAKEMAHLASFLPALHRDYH